MKDTKAKVIEDKSQQHKIVIPAASASVLGAHPKVHPVRHNSLEAGRGLSFQRGLWEDILVSLCGEHEAG